MWAVVIGYWLWVRWKGIVGFREEKWCVLAAEAAVIEILWGEGGNICKDRRRETQFEATRATRWEMMAPEPVSKGRDEKRWNSSCMLLWNWLWYERDVSKMARFSAWTAGEWSCHLWDWEEWIWDCTRSSDLDTLSLRCLFRNLSGKVK